VAEDKMRIAMMTNNYKPIVGGVPISVARLSQALRNRGHHVTILAPHMKDAEKEDGVIRFGSFKIPMGQGLAMPDPIDQTIANTFAENHFDLIHVHHNTLAGKIGMQMARKYDIPIAMTYHTRYECYLHYIKPYAMLQKMNNGHDIAWIHKALNSYSRSFMNDCDLIFTPTPYVRDFLSELNIYKPIKILPTGLSQENFQWDDTLVSYVKNHHGKGKKYLFCSVSRLAQEKNISFLLKSLAHFKQLHGDCWQMLMIGDGPCRQRFEHEANALRLSENIIFTGNIPQTQLSSFYKACDLFLFASKSETQGLVLHEAMAAALPVVAVKASGVCDIVRCGENGFMTSMDEMVFAHTMKDILTDRKLLEKLQEGAFKTAADCTDEKMAAGAEAAYIQILISKKQFIPENNSIISI
jgi:glycosyltransferase involved in cell wall biosynthesis